jgi:hypothetical protein
MDAAPPPAPNSEPLVLRERDYTALLGRCLSNRLDEPRLGALVREALASVLVHGPVSEAQSKLARPLHAVRPDGRLGAPDVLLVDRVAELAIEAKSLGAATHWSWLSTYRQLLHGTDGDSRKVVSQRLLPVAISDLAPHRDHASHPNFCDCATFIKTVRRGEHAPCLHQGDVYASTMTWIPAEYRPETPRDVTYVALLPSIASVEDFAADLLTGDLWCLARTRDFYDTLREQAARACGLSQSEQALLGHLITSTADFYALATPAEYAPHEWVNAWTH